MNASKISVLLDELQALLENIGYADNRAVGVGQTGNRVTVYTVILWPDGELRDIIDFRYDAELETWSWEDRTRTNVA